MVFEGVRMRRRDQVGKQLQALGGWDQPRRPRDAHDAQTAIGYALAGLSVLDHIVDTTGNPKLVW